MTRRWSHFSADNSKDIDGHKGRSKLLKNAHVVCDFVKHGILDRRLNSLALAILFYLGFLLLKQDFEPHLGDRQAEEYRSQSLIGNTESQRAQSNLQNNSMLSLRSLCLRDSKLIVFALSIGNRSFYVLRRDLRRYWGIKNCCTYEENWGCLMT